MKHRNEIARNASAVGHRALAPLRDLIEDSDLPRREIETRMGVSRGSQLLNGYIHLKVRHLEVLIELLGISPARFFVTLFPRRRPPARRRHRKPALRVSKDVIRIYGFGIDSVRELRTRIERCEEVLAAMARSGPLEDGS